MNHCVTSSINIVDATKSSTIRDFLYSVTCVYQNTALAWIPKKRYVCLSEGRNVWSKTSVSARLLRSDLVNQRLLDEKKMLQNTRPLKMVMFYLASFPELKTHPENPKGMCFCRLDLGRVSKFGMALQETVKITPSSGVLTLLVLMYWSVICKYQRQMEESAQTTYSTHSNKSNNEYHHI